MALSDEINTPTSPPLPISGLSDIQLIEQFKQNPVAFAKSLIGQPRQLNRFWQILEARASTDQSLINAYDKAQNILGKIPPTPQPQPEPETAKIPEIPEYKPAEEVIGQTSKETSKRKLDPESAKIIERWLNGIKPGYYEFLANQNRAQFGAATDRKNFTDSFLFYFSMYRSQLPEILWDEAVHGMLFTALGPLGDVWQKYYSWDMKRKISWMKNPLNPNAFYYWFNSLPTQEAFKVALIPVKAAWGIFVRGSDGLFTKAVYQSVERSPFSPEYGQAKIKQDYFFTPALKLTQTANRWAETLYRSSKTPRPEILNRRYNRLLNNLAAAKTQYFSTRKSGDKQARKDAALAVKNAHGNINTLLNRIDGNFFHCWSRPLKRNLSRRLKRASEDPLNGLLALLAGSIIDLALGIVVNLARTIITKTVGQIPAVNALRVQIGEYFTSSRWFKLINTARIGGATIGQFGRAMVSPTSFSSSYVGASTGGWVANAFGLPTYPAQIIGGGIGYGFGTLYRTSLNLANMGIYDYGGRLNPVGWTQQYDTMLARATDPMLSIQEQNYWRGQLESNYYRIDSRFTNLRPGPITRFGNWLYNHPYVRLPINGFVIADLGVKLFGWNPYIAYPSLMFGDWAWQTRAAWSKAFMEWLPKTPLGQWVGRQVFSVQSWGMRTFIARPTGAMIGNLAEWGPRPFAQGVYNIWSGVKPYAATAFNPGFWLGFGLAPLLTPTLGGWAWVAGPAIGSATWMAGTRILAAVTGMPYARFASMFNPLAFTGFFVGQLTGLAFFGWNIPFWYTATWTLGVPLIGMPFSIIASMAGISVPTLLGNIIAGITSNAISALAAAGAISTALAAWATVLSISLVAGLTIFFAYTIYAGFWVPMIEEGTARPESNNFRISNNCTQTGTNQYNCCSNFSVTENVFNTLHHLDHKTDFSNTELSVDLTNLSETSPTNNSVEAFRNATQLDYFHAYLNLNKDQFGVNPSGNVVYGTGTGLAAVLTYLTTPDDQLTNLKELMATNSSVVYSMKPLWDILVTLAEEKQNCQPPAQGGPGAGGGCNQSALISEYKKQLEILKQQKGLISDLIGPVKAKNWQKALEIIDDFEKKYPDNNAGNQYRYKIESLQAQADPNPAELVSQLEQDLETTEAQIDILNQIIEIAESVKSMMTEAKATEIIKYKNQFSSYVSLPEEDKNAIWNLLVEFFPKVFVNNQFYFVPKGTNYRVCMDMAYLGTLPAEPQTVCSTISYQPSLWNPNTSFAKSCTTFTPE